MHVTNAGTSFEIYMYNTAQCHMPINSDNFLTYAWHFLEGPRDAKKMTNFNQRLCQVVVVLCTAP